MDKRWDWPSIAAAFLCAVPEIVTTAYVGIPDDLGWELPVLLAISAAILATPQIVMFAFVRAVQSKASRTVFVLGSAGLVIAYALFVPTVDLASDAQAALAFPVFQILMAGAAAVAGGLMLWVKRRYLDQDAKS